MQTIPELFRAAAEAGVSIQTDEHSVTAVDLERQSRALAASLRALGVEPGDRVAAWLPNLPQYLSLYAAVTRLGAILVAVNNRFGAAEVADIVGRSESKVLVVASEVRGIDYVATLRAIDAAAVPALRHLILIADGAETIWPHVGAVTFASLTDAAPLDDDCAGPDTLSNIFTTSGTTAAPKFAAHAHAGVVGHALDVVDVLEMRAPGTVSLQLLPFCGVFGFVQVIAALAAGVKMVMPSGFDAREAAHLVIEHKATHLLATDDMIHRMIGPGCEEARSDTPFPHLKACAFALFNTYLTDLPARAEAHGIPMLAPFGMSEVFSVFAIRRHHQPMIDRHRAGGTLVNPRARVRARNPETGEILPDFEAGELELYSPHLFREYFGNSTATQAAMTDDGYLKTGDVGYTEPGNAFTYLQRGNDTLRLSGFLVSPAEIETAVMAAPGVADAQVVAVGTAGGNRPVAFVIEQAGAEVDEQVVIAAVGETLPKFKTPVRVISVDAFPVTDGANGTKIQRTKLREMAQAALAGGR
ncbi:MAG: AMP-binding protein [Rhodospirillaceae bacterium]|nr:AMP-binding protein [Rhodospirillaceae bacterium]